MAQPTQFYDYKCVVTQIDRMQDGRRIVPMKVLSLGLCRTGTESTTNALKLLGINQFYHGWQTIFDNPRDNKYWLEAIEAKFDGKGTPYGRKEFDKLLGHCQGVSDLPAILFAKELIEAYPEAKVILTHRNVDTWHKSCYDTIHSRVLHPFSKSLIPITFWLKLHSRYTRPCWIRAWNILTNYSKDFTRDEAQIVYDKHYNLVREVVAQQSKDQNNSKLLEYNVKEGWEPLCKFLEIPVPDVDFPKGNETSVFVKRFAVALKVTLQAILVRLFGLGALTWFAALAVKRVALYII